MADRIKGISIEIGGDTTKLDNALKDVNKSSKNLQKELRDVQRLIKFDPNNAELLAQRQKLLNEQIENTEKKLRTLQDAEADVQRQFEKGDIGQEQYRAFQRELADTQSYLRNTQNALQDLNDEQENVQKSTKELDRLFEVTGTTIEDFADVVGTRTVRAMQQGTASSKDLKQAFDKISKASVGASADVGEIRKALQQLESGESSIKGVQKQLQNLAKDAEDAQKDVKELGGELAGLVAGAGVGVGIGALIEKAIDVSDLDTTIEISMDIPDESKASVKDAIKTVGGYIDDVGTATDGVRKQFQLNADLTDAENVRIVKSAGTIAKAYANIDFTELIQETNEIAKGMNLSHDEALGMVKSLLDVGFPPEQLDIITEYGQQLERAGYDASEIQAIFEAGVETGTWNIDNLMDGLKEGRILLSEYGTEVPKAMADALEGTKITTDQVQLWGKAMAKGGEDGKQAMLDVANALAGIEDDTKRNELGVKFFGTMWEEQGEKITDTIIGASEKTVDLAENQRQLNDDMAKLDADPQQRLNKALTELWETLQPLLTKVAEFVTMIAKWVEENPELTATIMGIISAIGILMGIFLVLAPIITAVSTLAGILGVTIGAIATPVLLAIAVIASIIAIGVLLYRNWDEIVAKAKELYENMKESFQKLWTKVTEYMGNLKEDVKDIWDNVVKFFTDIDLKEIGKDIIQGLIDGIASMAGKVAESAKNIANGIGEKIKGILQIGSPSKLMMEMGQFTGEGLAIGIEKSMKQVKSVASQLGNVAIPEMKINVPKELTTPTGKNMVVNIHSPKALDVRDATKEFNRTLNKMSLMW